MSEPAPRPARPASTICVVRDGSDGIEVVMCRRTPSARFMGGSWVFPGGAVDAIDATELAAAGRDRSESSRAAARRTGMEGGCAT